MRVIALFFPHFSLQIELMSDPSIVGKPVVIGGYPHERKLVFDASPEAIDYGIQIGMPLRQAHGLCPEALCLPLAQERYQQVFEDVLDLIADFAPKTEAAALGEVFIEIPHDSWEVDLIGEIRLTVKEQIGLSMAVGSASARFPAQVGSRVAQNDGMITIPASRERAFLADLPVGFLPGPEATLRRLEMLGICKMGQLASLPRQEISLQFGTEGERLWQLARGKDSSKVVPYKKTPVLVEQLEFDPPAETFDHLLAGTQILTNCFGKQLDERWQHCQRMKAKLNFADDTIEIIIDFKLATASAQDMLRHLKQRLDSVQFSGPVTRIEITAENLCAEQSSQLKLLNNLPRCSESLLSAIRQLQAKYGSSIIKKSVRPKTFSRLPEGAFSLVDFA